MKKKPAGQSGRKKPMRAKRGVAGAASGLRLESGGGAPEPVRRAWLQSCVSVACIADVASIGRQYDAGMTARNKNRREKKSPLMKAGLKLFSWRRIVETGVIMLRCVIYV
ncbi:hypothetical protein H3H37_07700 [Duganella sp. LX20W]|uniref:Uncharacterized protein n=1 Tax=Rugamonas brunnea TaxID=2758569 RepID=A0A7W2ER08_9BURK|nr:hypothetical protein [Rugamonas brunnea]MBA5636935.1 hypothetical protein [Rugamonas brunnea]